MVNDIIRLAEYSRWDIEWFGMEEGRRFKTKQEAVNFLEKKGYRKVELEQENAPGLPPREIWVRDNEPEIDEVGDDWDYDSNNY